jgi:hypothetical protein
MAGLGETLGTPWPPLCHMPMKTTNHGRISWGIQGLPKVSLGSAMLDHSTACRRSPLKRPYSCFRGGRPTDVLQYPMPYHTCLRQTPTCKSRYGVSDWQLADRRFFMVICRIVWVIWRFFLVIDDCLTRPAEGLGRGRGCRQRVLAGGGLAGRRSWPGEG